MQTDYEMLGKMLVRWLENFIYQNQHYMISGRSSRTPRIFRTLKAIEILFLLSEDEGVAVVHYTLGQSEGEGEGMKVDHHIVKTIIRDIHSRAVEDGEKRKKINEVSGPSAKYMRGFYERHPEISKRLAERVDPGRINMASKDTT